MHARLQLLYLAGMRGAVCPGDGRDVVDAALPHPGCGWRASVLTGLAEEIGSGVDEPTLGPGPRTVFLQSGAVPRGVTWHVAAKMA